MKKLALTSLITLLAIFMLTITAYAFFVMESNFVSKKIESDTNEYIITVDSEYQLRKVAYDKYYNSNQKTSEIRKNIILQENIKLTSNLIINADVNINLGGYEIDFNDYDILIEHNYIGALIFSNGSIVNDNSISKLSFDTPKAQVWVSNIENSGVIINIIDSFDLNLVNKAFDYVSSKFLDGYIDDIDLVYYFSVYDMSFTYTSSNANILEDTGSLKQRPLEDTIVNLTLDITYNSITYNRTYPITIYGSDNDLLQLGKNQITEYLNKYLYNDRYNIYQSLDMPSGNPYLGLSYSYVFDEFFSGTIDNNTIMISLINEQSVLTATVTNQYFESDTITFDLNLIPISNYAIAYDIVVDIGAINIYNHLTIFSDLVQLADVSSLGVTAINYTISDEGATNYEIVDNEIRVLILPEMTVPIFLNVKIDFQANHPSSITKNIKINYVGGSSGGGGIGTDTFEEVYYYLLGELLDKAGNGVYNDFNMPRKYESLTSGVITNIDYRVTLQVPSLLDLVNLDANNIKFDIDFLSIPTYNMLVTVEFKDATKEGWYDEKGYFEILGVIHNNAQGIPENALYVALRVQYDINEDSVLTVNEAAEAKLSFTFENTTVASFKGIEFFINTEQLSFNNTTFRISDLLYLQNLSKLKKLSLQNNSLDNSVLAGFFSFNSLIDLDLSNILINNDLINPNTINSINGLATSTIMEKLNLSRNLITNIDGIERFIKLKELIINNNNISLFTSLKNLNSLQKVYLYSNVTTDQNYGSAGVYNQSEYVMLYNKGVKVYNLNANDYFEPNANYILGAGILHSIIYFKAINNISNEIYLPERIYYNLGNDYYEVYYNIPGNFNLSTMDVNGKVKLSIASLPASTTTYEIILKVIINTVEIYRVIFIEVIK